MDKIFRIFLYLINRGLKDLRCGIIEFGSDNERLVALTFDDGPHPVYTSKILNILKEENIKACFFLVGKNVEKYKDIAKRIYLEGHEIGNHTYSHKMLVPLRFNKVKEEIIKSQELIEEVTGKRPVYFRPPRGVYNKKIKRYVKDILGYKFVLWSLSTRDWFIRNPKKIKKRTVKYIKPGSIILFHDAGGIIRNSGGNRESTIKALPLIIRDLKERGYRIVPLRELLKSYF